MAISLQGLDRFCKMCQILAGLTYKFLARTFCMGYYRAYSKNRCVFNLLALWLSTRTCWQWAGPKLHSLLSAHCLVGTCFLTIESDKCRRLLTRLYSTTIRIYHSVQGKHPLLMYHISRGHYSSFYTNVWDFDPR